MLLSSAFFILVSSLFVARRAQAYPQYIGYGYQSCANCHYNPLGNGPLTDYGRALGATTIAAKPFWAGKGTTDEDLAASSGFLGNTNIGDYIRPSLTYRSLYYRQDVGQPNTQHQYINMVADANLVVKTPDQKLYVSGTLGYLPPSQTLGQGTTLISREHYIGYQAFKKVGFYVGLMDVAYGLRVPDHTAFSRSTILLGDNDQTHGAMVFVNLGEFEGAFHVFVGNLIQNDPTARLAGFSTTGEYMIKDQLILGYSVYHASNEYRSRTMGELHTRIGTGNGNAIIAEFGVVNEKITMDGTSTLGNYAFIQEFYTLSRGFNFIFTAQYYTQETFGPNARFTQIGPGLTYFPFQRLELRTEIDVLNQFGSGTIQNDHFDWLTQIHVWL